MALPDDVVFRLILTDGLLFRVFHRARLAKLVRMERESVIFSVFKYLNRLRRDDQRWDLLRSHFGTAHDPSDGTPAGEAEPDRLFCIITRKTETFIGSFFRQKVLEEARFCGTRRSELHDQCSSIWYYIIPRRLTTGPRFSIGCVHVNNIYVVCAENRRKIADVVVVRSSSASLIT